jgi:hypothetical protein
MLFNVTFVCKLPVLLFFGATDIMSYPLHALRQFKPRRKHKRSEKQMSTGIDKAKLERTDVEPVQIL